MGLKKALPLSESRWRRRERGRGQMGRGGKRGRANFNRYVK